MSKYNIYSFEKLRDQMAKNSLIRQQMAHSSSQQNLELKICIGNTTNYMILSTILFIYLIYYLDKKFGYNDLVTLLKTNKNE